MSNDIGNIQESHSQAPVGNPDQPIKRILIVDDDEQIRLVLSKALERSGYEICLADESQHALEKLAEWPCDLVITDISMPGDLDGIDLLKEIRARCPDTDVIVMTGYGSDYSYVDIMDAGATDYMTKPFSRNSALARINRIAREKSNLINLRRTNQELCQAIERSNILAREAKEASKAKTFFLASMSHEIRTPLNGIVGYTDMLLDTQLNDEQRLYLNNAKMSCDTLLSVVNDILDFSKVEAGKLSLGEVEFDPEVLFFDTINVVRTKVDESQVEFLCSISENLPAKVIGDPHRFRQVLLNLLGNAAKFTSKGSISLTAEAELFDHDRVQLTVCVADTGIGLAEDQLEKIFSPFVQSDDDIAGRYGGTGLGLAISRNIAAKMGGDVWAECGKQTGSVFYFTSRVRQGSLQAERRVRPAALKGRRVLFSTTTPISQDVLAYDFNMTGMTAEHVPLSELPGVLDDITNTPEDSEDSRTYDIGLVDFGKLPKIDMAAFKTRVSKIVRPDLKMDWIAASIPVPGIADILQKAGFKGFLPRPISRTQLMEMLGYVIGKKDGFEEKKSEPIATTHLLSENKKRASILMAEDNPVNQKMMSIMLGKAGYSADIASDGKEVLEQYAAQPDRYDIIFMDINMPNMDGFEATKRIRQFENDQVKNDTGDTLKRPHIPIVALTANVLDGFKEKCRAVGMDDFLSKPINREKVFTAIQQWAGSGR